MYCDQRGEPLERFEGETYCPNCTHWEVVEPVGHGDEERGSLQGALPQHLLPDPLALRTRDRAGVLARREAPAGRVRRMP